MISAYSIHGMSKDATTLFEQMELMGIAPDRKTCTVLLSAHARDGLVEEG